jgi:magnesium-transporting ATPase (P-type)
LIAEGNKDGASAHDVPSPLMLSGSKVLSGEGKMVVIAVGKFSAIGKI